VHRDLKGSNSNANQSGLPSDWEVNFYVQYYRPFIYVGSELISGSMKNREGRYETYLHQGSIYFPKMYAPPPNSGRQKSGVKQVS
jgi:hypothetical protein